MLQHRVFRYTAAIAATMLAWMITSFSPALHDRAFFLFLAAVIVSARFLGFGPGIFTTLLSLCFIDYLMLEPHFQISRSASDLEELVIFLAVAVLTAGLARQKSKADIRADEAQRHMAAIVESSQDAILSKDTNGIITTWNHGAERLYGYRADEVIGKHVSILAPAEHPDEIPWIMRTLLRGESIRHYMTERVRKDGTRLTVYLSVSPLVNQKGEILGASTIAQDVTAQRRAEEALRKTEKLATAGRLAAAIAHEINNPLEAIGNLLYLARRDKAKCDEYLQMAEKEVGRVTSIAQQTLGFVRDPSSASEVEVGPLLEEVLNLYKKKISAKHIQLEKAFEPGLGILAFSGELRQLFSNLIANAIEATPDKGKLHIRIERSREWSNNHRPGVRVMVADTGTGIAPEHTTHIFEPFFTTKKDSGTGLGLWLSYSIVQKHGGYIRFRTRTTPGRSGTVFNVFLPEKIQPTNAAS